MKKPSNWWRSFLIALALSVAWFATAQAQTLHEDVQEIIEAEVVAVTEEFPRPIFGTDTVVTVQVLEAQVRSGIKMGQRIRFENELAPLTQGDVVYLTHQITINGDESFIFKDFKRQTHLWWLFVSFAVLLVWFAGKQGALALLSLLLSVLAIVFVLIPALLAGYDPVWVSLGVSSIILSFVLFITHGVSARSVIAFGGTFAAVAVTCLLAWFWVGSMRLSGMGDDITVFLNFSTNGQLDFGGLLLGSIIIGILGVLDDVAITQASVVQELRRANTTLGMSELYGRAIRVGRDHVGSLVNTLALAYVGVSLPLILLYAAAESEWYLALNQEVVAAELVRILVGSFGLVLAVPFTTILAAWYFARQDSAALDEASCGHGHHH